jgi:hypothetical protein
MERRIDAKALERMKVMVADPLYKDPQSIIQRQANVDEVSSLLWTKAQVLSVKRFWVPGRDISPELVSKQADKLEDDTLELLLADLGVEEYIQDFVGSGLEGLRFAHRSRVRQLLGWGAEEQRHGQGLEIIQLKAGGRAKTLGKIDEYYRRLRTGKRWETSQHIGMVDPIGGTVYPMFQEPATKVNYQEAKRLVITQNDLPEKYSERTYVKDGNQVGIVGTLELIEADENAHGAFYLELGRDGYLPNFPLEFLEKIDVVIRNFHMPAEGYLPNWAEFKDALERTKVFTGKTYMQKVVTPVLKGLGFESRGHFRDVLTELRTATA